MYRFKQLIFIALFLLGNAYSFGQCKQFNLNISYDKQVVHITPELTHNGVFSYKGIWYSDSIAVNQKSHLQNTNYTYKCLILKYDNIGHVVNHMNLILPTPNSTPNLRLDPSTGGLVYVISVDDKKYPINDTLSIDARGKAVIGIVRIDSNLNKVQFVKIAETAKYQHVLEGQHDIYCAQTGATMSVYTKSKLYLNNGDSIYPSTALEIHSLQLDAKFKVVQKMLLAQTDMNILGEGMVNTPNGFYYFIKYFKSINVPATGKLYSNTVRKLNLGVGLDGWDFLILKQVNNQIVSSYTIGCPYGLRSVGGQSNFYYANNRFYFPHYNLGQNVYDNNMQMLQAPLVGRNALAIFDTAFNITKLSSFVDKPDNTNVWMGLFKSATDEITLIANSDSTFEFNGKTYTPQSNSDPTQLNVFFSVIGDSIQYIRSQNTINYKCYFTDYSSKSATFNLYSYPGKKVASASGMILKSPVYKQHFWVVKICSPGVESPDIETTRVVCYPNPLNQGALQVDATHAIQSIAVLTMKGQVVFEKSPNATNTLLDLRNLPDGNYLVRTQLADQVNTQKIIVLH